MESVVGDRCKQPWSRRLGLPTALERGENGTQAEHSTKWLANLRDRVQFASLEITYALAAAVEAKDSYTERHSLNVRSYCSRIARRLGLSADELETVEIAAVLHDVGKIGVPDAILAKPGPLTPCEYAVIQQHPVIGVGILRNVTLLQRVLPAILHHHERWDGGGYPAGLAGERIPRSARILHVADALDAMLSCRVYKPSLSPEEARAELTDQRGRQFDPQVVDVAEQGLGEGTSDDLLLSHC
jgi:putative nucleotidyltransferase with HDIG domain